MRLVNAPEPSTTQPATTHPTPRQPWAALGMCAAAALVVVAIFYAAPTADPQWQGMELEPLTAEMSVALGLPRGQPGVYVSDVVGIALQAGVREGDVVVAINGAPTPDTRSLRAVTAGLPDQATVRVDVVRRGATQTLYIGPGASLPGAQPAALAVPPACATCPNRTGCLPGGTTVALPPACATCPSRAGCLPPVAYPPGAGYTVLPGQPLAPPVAAPFQAVALPCTTGACPVP